MEGRNHDKLWEKCARRLLLNTGVSLLALESILSKVLLNLIHNPNEMKYRILRTANGAVKSSITDVPGGIEFLAAVGFSGAMNDQGDKVLQIQGDTSALDDALLWLHSTCDTYRKFLDVKGSGLEDSCADTEVQIRLPTGSSVLGGFMKGDRLRDVRSFAACYFTDERASAVRVIVPSTGGDPDDAIWDSTLEELHMYPRAVVFASIYTTKEKEALLEKNHAREAAIERGKAVKIRSEKKDTVDAHKASQQERSRILAAFRDDHVD